MSFSFIECISKDGKKFDGIYEIQPKIFGDHRGYFFESYNEKDFFDAGLKMKFVQDNQSFSTKAVLRGLHFQKNHPQGKLIRAVTGKIYDVVVDLRKGSKTFACYFGLILDSEKQNQLYIPQGFAHGFLVLSKSATIAYKCTDFYHPEDEGGLIWNDETIAINWPAKNLVPKLSAKDKNHPKFRNDANYFNMDGTWIGED